MLKYLVHLQVSVFLDHSECVLFLVNCATLPQGLWCYLINVRLPMRLSRRIALCPNVT
jgi:hypothetical protein